jgi:hypothetical protein
MSVFVVAEEPTDVQLLQRLLPAAADPEVRVVDGGISTSATSVASSIRAVRGVPVILVLNARTVDEESMLERGTTVRNLLRYGGPPVRSELVFAVPELEVVLFHDPEVLERLLGVEIPESARIEARFIPKKVLARLLEQSGRFAGELELVEALDDAAAKRLAQHPLVQQLEALIADVRAQPVPEQYRLRPTG